MRTGTRLTTAAALALMVAGAAGCSIGEGGRAAPVPLTTTPTTSPSSRVTLPPATTVACPQQLPPRAEPDPNRPRYSLQVDVRPGDKAASGTEQVHFTPDLDTDRIVLRLWPNSPDLANAGAHLDVTAVTLGGNDVPNALESPTRLTLHPPDRLPAGQDVVVALKWSLTLPDSVNDRISVTGDSVRLGSFFPILPWEPGYGWATDPATGGFAEDSTAPTADYDVTISAPPGLSVLASGVPDRPGHWTANEMRDVAISVGRFATSETTASAPDPVKIVVGVDPSLPDSADGYAAKAKAVLEDFGRRYGAYPWATLSLGVTPNLQGGIEYPTHIMLGPGTFGDTETHEIGHQWFYALVGNDQGRDPWMDEGLATWAQLRFQDTLASARLARVPPAAKGQLGQPRTFWKDHEDLYDIGVYTQGAQALDALGPGDLVDCALRVYVVQNAYRIARPADFVAAMKTVFPDADATLAGFGIKT